MAFHVGDYFRAQRLATARSALSRPGSGAIWPVRRGRDYNVPLPGGLSHGYLDLSQGVDGVAERATFVSGPVVRLTQRYWNANARRARRRDDPHATARYRPRAEPACVGVLPDAGAPRRRRPARQLDARGQAGGQRKTRSARCAAIGTPREGKKRLLIGLHIDMRDRRWRCSDGPFGVSRRYSRRRAFSSLAGRKLPLRPRRAVAFRRRRGRALSGDTLTSSLACAGMFDTGAAGHGKVPSHGVTLARRHQEVWQRTPPTLPPRPIRATSPPLSRGPYRARPGAGTSQPAVGVVTAIAGQDLSPNVEFLRRGRPCRHGADGIAARRAGR